MRSTLIALVATFVLSAPVLARAHDCCCDDCCDGCADSAQSSAASSVDADAVLKVLAQYGFYLGPYADQMGEGGGIAIGGSVTSTDAEDGGMAVAKADDVEGVAIAVATASAAPADPDDSLHTFVFHCPVNFNNSEPIPQDKLDALEKHLCELAGGFTMSEAEGAWVNEGKLYHEPMRRYMIGVSADGIDALEDYAVDTLKQDFGQINVWVEVDGEAEIL